MHKYSTYISSYGFVLTLWWKFGLEIYLYMVNYKTWVHCNLLAVCLFSALHMTPYSSDCNILLVFSALCCHFTSHPSVYVIPFQF